MGAGDLIVVLCSVALVSVSVIVWFCWRDESRASDDVRFGRWMRDLEFLSRWSWVRIGRFTWGGFSRRHVPGVVCCVLNPTLDYTGQPRAAEECVVVITDDLARSARDLLLGRLDGEAFPRGCAWVALHRRMGDPNPLAANLVQDFDAHEVLSVFKGRVRFIDKPLATATTGQVHAHPTTTVVPRQQTFSLVG